MRTFPRLLRELPKKVSYNDLSSIYDSYINISKSNLPYFSKLSIDESMRLILSTWFSNNGMKESVEDLITTDKIYLMVVLEKSDEVGFRTCESCDGSGRFDCDDCNGGSYICEECSGNGNVDCQECEGSGENENGEECGECDGTGEEDCILCDDGYIECDECNGRGDSECETCDGDGLIEVEGSIRYDYYIYILTRMSQVKEVENSFMVKNQIPQNYLMESQAVIDKIEDFDTPHKIYYMSDITPQYFGEYFLQSPFRAFTQNGYRTMQRFKRRLNDEIFDDHYTPYE